MVPRDSTETELDFLEPTVTSSGSSGGSGSSSDYVMDTHNGATVCRGLSRPAPTRDISKRF